MHGMNNTNNSLYFYRGLILSDNRYRAKIETAKPATLLDYNTMKRPELHKSCESLQSVRNVYNNVNLTLFKFSCFTVHFDLLNLIYIPTNALFYTIIY